MQMTGLRENERQGDHLGSICNHLGEKLLGLPGIMAERMERSE